jgi:hypothetical protein
MDGHVDGSLVALAPHDDGLAAPLDGRHPRTLQARHVATVATIHVGCRDDGSRNDRAGQALSQLAHDGFDFG